MLARLREWWRYRREPDPPLCQVDPFGLRIAQVLQEVRAETQANEEELRRVRDRRNVRRLQADAEYYGIERVHRGH